MTINNAPRGRAPPNGQHRQNRRANEQYADRLVQQKPPAHLETKPKSKAEWHYQATTNSNKAKPTTDMNTVVIKTEIAVPTGILVEVANVLLEHELAHQIVGADEEDETITLELEYERDQRGVIHEIEDLITDYEEGEEDEEEEKGGEEKER